LLLPALLPGPSPLDKQTKEDIERHRAMAAAHEAAAKCLEGGKGHDQCMKRPAGGLQKPGHRKILRHEARALSASPALAVAFFAD
jgi:hypothetical protein